MPIIAVKARERGIAMVATASVAKAEEITVAYFLEWPMPFQYAKVKGLYDEATKLLGERGVVEVIGLCGYYTLVSMTLNSFEFGLPEGEVSDLA